MKSGIETSAATHTGYVREGNEDRFLISPLDPDSILLCIADGMGGHAAGEIAAQMAVDTLLSAAPGDAVEAHLAALHHLAHERITEAASKEPSLRGMATTLTTLLIRGETAFWAHIGDTRLYLLRSGRLTQVTDDHTVPGNLLKRGEITREEAREHPFRHMLTRCLGCQTHEPDTGCLTIEPADILLLSSDGLHDLIADETIASILGRREDLTHGIDSLIASALDAGGRDNITCVAAELLHTIAD